jgi:TetR/AcrR family transcriptional regulator
MPPSPRRAGRPRNPVARADLLAHARRAFAAGGYRATSLSRLAEAAGIRKSSLLHHFESKEALYLEALAEPVGQLGQLIEEARAARGDYAQRLDALGSAVADYLTVHPHVAAVLYRELLEPGPFMQGPGSLLADAALGAAVRFLQAGIDTGAFAAQDARRLAFSFVVLHLAWVATPQLAVRLGIDEAPVEAAKAEATRKAALLGQLRLLCGVAGR